MSFFPDVPPLPGVPTLPRMASAPTYVPPTLLTRDMVALPPVSMGPPWGIYKDGQPVIVAETVVAFGYRQDWSVMNYPVEEGGFQTYNKVNTPYDVRLRFVTGGSEADRTDMIKSIEAMAGDTEVYDVYTPEVTYNNLNVVHYDYERRSNDGVGLLKIDIWLVEIRQPDGDAGAASNVKDPAAADEDALGTVQPEDVEPERQETYDELLAEAEALGLF